MAQLDFHGRVAVVTGAGRGIGFAHAQLLAGRGCHVMVNDLGTAMVGGGSDSSLASQAADRIRSDGYVADADGSDIATISGAESLIAHTVDSFGRVDIIVNNAGIYTVDEFPSVSLADVEKQLGVHVGGSFNVTRAAWPHFSAQQYGRVVMTTSTGALGAANMTAYGTAKAGVLGLGRALARAGEPVGVRVNVIAPMAMTPMMSAGRGQGGEPPEDAQRDPRLVAPLVAVLCHESCPSNGETYLTGMRRYARFVIEETEGYVHPDLDVTPEALVEHWERVIDPGGAHIVADTMSWAAANDERISLLTLDG